MAKEFFYLKENKMTKYKSLSEQINDDIEEAQLLKQSIKEYEIYEKQINDLRKALIIILDQVDYTVGNCRVNEMVGAVLPKEIIQMARNILDLYS
jgi:Cdc6-like AAA superfamily ATPase